MNKVVAVLAMLAYAASAQAAPKALFAPSLGTGQRLCSEWSAARTRGGWQSQLYAAWAMGYFSGYNQFAPSGKSFFWWYDTDNVLQALDHACKNNPEQRVSDTAAQFVFLLYKPEIRTPRRTN